MHNSVRKHFNMIIAYLMTFSKQLFENKITIFEPCGQPAFLWFTRVLWMIFRKVLFRSLYLSVTFPPTNFQWYKTSILHNQANPSTMLRCLSIG